MNENAKIILRWVIITNAVKAACTAGLIGFLAYLGWGGWSFAGLLLLLTVADYELKSK